MGKQSNWKIAFWLAFSMLPVNFAHAQLLDLLPEQRQIRVRQPGQLPSIPVPDVGTPLTVETDPDTRRQQRISLDEAIRIAIQNAEVIRVLTGVSARRSASTIYDVAIQNTAIDLQNSVFDPTMDLNLSMNKVDRPGSTFDPFDPTNAIFAGSSTDSINTTFGLQKRGFSGGTVGLNANAVGSYFEPGVFPLDPEYRSFVELSLRQPLAQGFGRDVNLAPVVIARIDTERSYFQFKDSVQELVRSVIEAYWNIVAARVNVWARRQQVEQADFAVQRATARQARGLARAADVAQARSALANFRAGLITARSNLILRETALLNIMGLNPSTEFELVPTSKPVLEQVDFDWDKVISMAEQYRPDIIELKLILEADQQRLVQANNSARPQLDGIANYRWDGLSGEAPNGLLLQNDAGRFQGFNLGVNFSVPMGLRADRATLRRQELILSRDKINIEQGIHQMIHDLTINYRNLDQFFEQYVAFKEARVAARLNFENQAGEVLAGRREFLNVLQAITDWGNAVSQEAASITQYNTELANIERQTGTILETHGISFYEERMGSLGPIGLLGARRTEECYPAGLQPEGGNNLYQNFEDTSDEAFNLEDLNRQSRDRKIELDALPQAPEIEAPRPPANATTESPQTSANRNLPAIDPTRVAAKRERLLDRLKLKFK